MTVFRRKSCCWSVSVVRANAACSLCRCLSTPLMVRNGRCTQSAFGQSNMFVIMCLTPFRTWSSLATLEMMHSGLPEQRFGGHADFWRVRRSSSDSLSPDASISQIGAWLLLQRNRARTPNRLSHKSHLSLCFVPMKPRSRNWCLFGNIEVRFLFDKDLRRKCPLNHPDWTAHAAIYRPSAYRAQSTV